MQSGKGTIFNKTGGKKMSIEHDIKSEYIAEIHYNNLVTFLNRVKVSSQASFPYIVGFRKTGEYSILMLNAGAAAKPHSILAKTIKDDTMTAAEKACPPLTLLYGLVAHRDSKEEIDGLYRAMENQETPLIFSRKADSDLIGFISQATNISRVNVEALMGREKKEILALMKDTTSIYSAAKYAYQYVAGDYDLHDLIQKVSKWGPIPSDCDDERRALNLLNNIFMTGNVKLDKSPTEFIWDTYYPVQHGPQYNYIAHMYDKEKDKKLVGKVAAASFPVLMLNMGTDIEWKIIKNIDELRSYYETHSINIKNSWGADFETYIAARQDKTFYEYMRSKK